MGVRFYANQTSENAAGAAVQRVFVKQIAGGVWRDVILQRARIKLLIPVSNRNCQQIATRSFANQPTQAFEP